jgi:hypothetical protein
MGGPARLENMKQQKLVVNRNVARNDWTSPLVSLGQFVFDLPATSIDDYYAGKYWWDFKIIKRWSSYEQAIQHAQHQSKKIHPRLSSLVFEKANLFCTTDFQDFG